MTAFCTNEGVSLLPVYFGGVIVEMKNGRLARDRSTPDIPLRAFPETRRPIHPVQNKDHLKKLKCSVTCLIVSVILNFILTITSLSITIAQFSQQSAMQGVSGTQGMPGMTQ